MGKRIIVAGLGHGGIAAAAQLARAGYDVTVYEKKKEGTLGYDWTDIFAPGPLAEAGIPMPDESKYEYKQDMTFYSPSERVALEQHVPEDDREIKMERRDIYEHLINHALECGVKIEYETEVLGPVLLGNRVVGINTDKDDYYGDLIIDACGMLSPVRMNLPDHLGIEKEPARIEYITIYRAFYNVASDEEPEAKFKVMLFKDNKLGMSWVASEEDHTDVLIGRFEDFDMEEVERFTDVLRQTSPRIGREVLRGGQFVKIPVRQPLSLMVADGYAAIGDSAFMTVPLIGSGIANCLRASRILADSIISDPTDSFSVETLWKYQYNFYKSLGSGLAALAAGKLLLPKLTADEVDYFFDSGMITSDDITFGADFVGLSSMSFSFPDLLNKAKHVCKNTDILKKLPAAGARISAVTAACAGIPKRYSPDKVRNWKKIYEMPFKNY